MVSSLEPGIRQKQEEIALIDTTPMMMVHVTIGGVALFAGFFALLSKKGRLVHRIAGRAFVFSMVIMALAGSIHRVGCYAFV